MKNFNFHARTEILFGKGQIEALPKALAPYGKKVLLVYGIIRCRAEPTY